MTQFCTRNIPTLFGVQFLSFSISKPEKCFGQIWTAFPGPDTTVVGSKQEKLKTRPDDSILHPKHTHTIWGAILIVSRQYG